MIKANFKLGKMIETTGERNITKNGKKGMELMNQKNWGGIKNMEWTGVM